MITYKRMATAETNDLLDPAVMGARVRALRESSSLSLRDLAARSGVSAPMLSQVERGETSPTLDRRRADRRGPRIAPVAAPAPGRGRSGHDRPRERRRHGGNARRGHRFEILTADRPGQRAQLSRHVLEPGGATGAPDDPPMHEPGSRETALVEQGRVVLVCDGEHHELAEGDCVTFDADLPHHFENPTDREAAFLAVLSAGLRRS